MPHTPSSRPHLQLENQICFAVHSAAHAFAQAYKPHLEPLGLTYPQYLVMLLLWEKDDRSVRELGEPLFLDSGTLTPLLKRLQTQGLIARTRDDKDERVVRITLSEDGKALRERAEAVPAAMLCAMGLSVDELISLKTKVADLGKALRAA